MVWFLRKRRKIAMVLLTLKKGLPKEGVGWEFVSLLTFVTSIVQFCVYLPNGEEALVTHIGTVQISSTLTLTRVLCVPSFNFNLIFISKLTKSLYCCLLFLGNCCFIQDLTQWSTIGLGKECNGLYLLQDSTPHTALVVNGHSFS